MNLLIFRVFRNTIRQSFRTLNRFPPAFVSHFGHSINLNLFRISDFGFLAWPGCAGRPQIVEISASSLLSAIS
jgi:hypothetical protein